MKISVICPTRNRQHFLPQLVRLFQSQTWQDKELLILDDSPTPLSLVADGVQYFHSAQPLSIGAKRNRLIELSKGEAIAHFDDDDFYAPHYLATLAAALDGVDLVKLDGWYLLSSKDSFFGYWNTREVAETHHPVAPWQITWDDAKRASIEEASESIRWGFGFSYLYRRRLSQEIPFTDMDFGEDYDFVHRAQNSGNFSFRAIADDSGLCLHMVHDGNSSGCYPQTQLPMSELRVHFPTLPRARICLSMIVKNEAHVIERCLRSVKPFVDAWAICDTGSTDGTQDIIRRFMGDLPGELIERPWVDFATNRNEALDLSRKYGDHALVIDADDVLETDAGFAWPELGALAYMIEIVDANDTRYGRVALPRLDANWKWQGVLHEALCTPQPVSTPYLRGLRILRIFNDGARSKQSAHDKFSRDADILRRALIKEPANARYAFYLAQSLRDAGLPSEALAAYEKRVTMGGWAEEVYFSKLQIATLLERTNAPYAQIVAAWIDAYDYRPTRAEAPCELARYLRLQQRYTAAREFGKIACAIPKPDDLLFLDEGVYAWRARDELSISAYWSGDKALSAKLCRELLADPRLPAAHRERVQKNLEFSEPKT